MTGVRVARRGGKWVCGPFEEWLQLKGAIGTEWLLIAKADLDRRGCCS